MIPSMIHLQRLVFLMDKCLLRYGRLKTRMSCARVLPISKTKCPQGRDNHSEPLSQGEIKRAVVHRWPSKFQN